jgi:hypothetical protein
MPYFSKDLSAAGPARVTPVYRRILHVLKRPLHLRYIRRGEYRIFNDGKKDRRHIRPAAFPPGWIVLS